MKYTALRESGPALRANFPCSSALPYINGPANLAFTNCGRVELHA